jgi:hypothetical protein
MRHMYTVCLSPHPTTPTLQPLSCLFTTLSCSLYNRKVDINAKHTATVGRVFERDITPGPSEYV